MRPVPIGARGESEQAVEFRHTLTAYYDKLPPVLSTPDMIRLMETAGFWALAPFCDSGEISVGTHIDVEHRAPCGVGARVKAEAVVAAFDGRFYTLLVSASELDPEQKEIGRGTIQRAIVNLDSFLQKMGGQCGSAPGQK